MSFDPNEQKSDEQEQDVETILESEITESDYQFTEKGYDLGKE